MSLEEDSLPDVSICDSLSISSTAQSYTPKKNASSCLNKLNSCKEKVKGFNKHIEEKKQVDELIRTEGYKFDEKAQIRVEVIDENEEVALDPSHEAFLHTLIDNNDPLIPIAANLDNHFDLNKCNINRFWYPLESFTNKFIADLANKNPSLNKNRISEFVTINNDIELFFKYFVQIPTHDLRKQVLTGLFLNIPSFVPFNIMSIAEILTEVLAQTQNDWYISGGLVFELFKSLGLNMEKFQTMFPDLVELNTEAFANELSVINGMKSEKIGEACSKHKFDFIFARLIELLNFSIKTKSKCYKENELDFMFILVSYVVLEDNHEIFDKKNEIQVMLSNIFDLYPEPTMSAKIVHLISYLVRFLGVELKHIKDKYKAGNKAANNNNEYIYCLNNLYHKLIYMIDFYGFTSSKRLKKLRSKLAYVFLTNLLSNSVEEDQSQLVREKANLYTLLELFKKECTNLFTESSYTMYNILKLLDVALTEEIRAIPYLNRIEYLENLKLAVNETSRQVKDKQNCEGRVQVKVIISNFLFTLDHSLSKLKAKRAHSQLSLNDSRCGSNFIFNKKEFSQPFNDENYDPNVSHLANLN